jgi:hypothetical protein
MTLKEQVLNHLLETGVIERSEWKSHIAAIGKRLGGANVTGAMKAGHAASVKAATAPVAGAVSPLRQALKRGGIMKRMKASVAAGRGSAV